MTIVRKGLIPYQGYKHVIPIGQGIAYGNKPQDTTTLGGTQTAAALVGAAFFIGLVAFLAIKGKRGTTSKRVTRIGDLEISDYGGKDRTIGLKGLPLQLKLNRHK